MFQSLWELVYLCKLFLWLGPTPLGVTNENLEYLSGPSPFDRSGLSFCSPSSMGLPKVLTFSASLTPVLLALLGNVLRGENICWLLVSLFVLPLSFFRTLALQVPSTLIYLWCLQTDHFYAFSCFSNCFQGHGHSDTSLPSITRNLTRYFKHPSTLAPFIPHNYYNYFQPACQYNPLVSGPLQGKKPFYINFCVPVASTCFIHTRYLIHIYDTELN